MNDQTSLPLAVIGGGVVGYCAARALQRAGRRVVVIDPLDPGDPDQTSYGNAGYIADNYVQPMARFDVLKKVPRMLLDPEAPLVVRPRSLPQLLPWMARFALATREEQVARGARAIAALSRGADAAWSVEIQASGLGELFQRQGVLYVYTTDEAFRGAEHERRLEIANGIKLETMNGDAARALVPGLTPSAKHATFLPNGRNTVWPQGVVRALAERFAAAGGEIRRDRVIGATGDGRTARTLRLASGDLAVGGVVIAAGRASREIATLFRFNAPLVAERGYHVMLEPDGVRFGMPLTWVERSYFVTPMKVGLRLAGTVELSTPDAPPTWRRADLLVKHTRELLPGIGGKETGRWMGVRPTLPDYVPAIGAAPRWSNVWCAYGHQHIGLTLAAVTARHLAALIVEKTPLPDDLAGCDPGRFE